MSFFIVNEVFLGLFVAPQCNELLCESCRIQFGDTVSSMHSSELRWPLGISVIGMQQKHIKTRAPSGS